MYILYHVFRKFCMSDFAANQSFIRNCWKGSNKQDQWEIDLELGNWFNLVHTCANYTVHPSTSDQVVVVVKPLQQGVNVIHLAVPSATLDSELVCAQVSDAWTLHMCLL